MRRFNWFDYGGNDTFGTMNDPHVNEEMGMLEDLTRMVLNPDVTIRSRGLSKMLLLRTTYSGS